MGIHGSCCSEKPKVVRVAPPIVAPQTQVVIEEPAPLPPPPPREVVVVRERAYYPRPHYCPPPCPICEPPCPICEPAPQVHVVVPSRRYYPSCACPTYPYREQCAECESCAPSYSAPYDSGCVETYSDATVAPTLEQSPSYVSPVPGSYESATPQTYDDSEPIVRSQSYSPSYGSSYGPSYGSSYGSSYDSSYGSAQTSKNARYYSPVVNARREYDYRY